MAASYIATYGFCVLLKNNSTCEQQLEIVPPSLHLVDDLLSHSRLQEASDTMITQGK